MISIHRKSESELTKRLSQQLSEKTAEVEQAREEKIKVLHEGNFYHDQYEKLSKRCARLEGLLRRAKYYVPDEANTLLVEISSALESKE